jgi:predicted CXXCH cytochrome family protein
MTRLAGRPTSLGTDLSDDHPIMVDYDEASRENEELAPRASLPDEFGLSGDATVQCTTCHEPHRNTSPPFLVADNARSSLCVTCHLTKGWAESIHRTSPARWNGRGKNPFHLSDSRKDSPTVADGACESCHTPHGADEGEWLLKGDEEKLCAKCHNGNVAESDVESEFRLPYGHHVGRWRDVHDAYENIDPLGRTLDGPDNDNITRHVECADCHNPHAAGTRKHAPGTNEASDVLRGVSGVKLTYGGTSGEPPTFKWVPAIPGVSYEYEICMKCHSSWIWESLPPETSDGTIQTDVSVEFNPNNESYHAVIGESRASTFGDYVSPWTSRSKMYCSDCHRGDGTRSSSGAHASRVRFLLAGSYDRTTGRPGTGGHLCFGCHRFSTYADPASSKSWTNTGFATKNRKNLHAVHAGRKRTDTKRTVVCRDCHAAVPHGIASNRALIVDEDDESPYRDAEAGVKSVDVWPLPQAWENNKKDNCSTIPGCHGGP